MFTSFNKNALVVPAKKLVSIPGNKIKDRAKIIGITPAGFNVIGKYVEDPPYTLFCIRYGNIASSFVYNDNCCYYKKSDKSKGDVGRNILGCRRYSCISNTYGKTRYDSRKN